MQGEFADCVLGGAPVAYECPLHHRAHLSFQGHGKLAAISYLVFQGLGEVAVMSRLIFATWLAWFAEFN